MKSIIMAVTVLFGLAGGAYCENALDSLKLAAPAPAIAVTVAVAPEKVITPEVKKSDTDENLAAQQRVMECYAGPHRSVVAAGSHSSSMDVYALVKIEAARAFSICQTKREVAPGQSLQKKNPEQSSGSIILALGDALRKDLPEFARVFSQLIK